jgi:hypothetical protein
MGKSLCTPGRGLARGLLTCCAAATLCGAAAARAEGVVPDRPGFSTGTYTVDPGQVGVEVGYEMAFGNADSPGKRMTAPLLDLRIGATPDLEIDLMWTGWVTEHTAGRTSTASGDGMIAGKLSLSSSVHAHLSLLGGISLPSGSAASSGHVDPTLSLLWDYTLSDAVTAFGMLQFAGYRDEGDHRVVFQPAAGLSIALSDRLGSFVELYGDVPLGSGTQRSRMVDTGLTYLLTENLQLDFSLGLSLDRRADDFVGTGVAMLF